MQHQRIRPFNTRDTYPEQRIDNDLCQAVVARGTMVFLRGQCPQNLDDAKNIDSHDPVEQTHKVMQNIRQLIEECGGTMEHLVKVVVYITDVRYREAVYRTMGEYIKGVHPVSTGLVVTALARPEWLVEIDGTKGSLVWRQENPNEMIVRQNGQPHKIYTRDPNAPFILGSSAAACRLPSGHPEGFFEAFANVYAAAFDAMVLRSEGKEFEKVNTIYPNVNDGVEGMYFIQQCVASSQQNGAWLPLNHERARR